MSDILDDGWTAAPPDSHLTEFRFDPGEPDSYLTVRFRPSKSAPSGAAYRYLFAGPSGAEAGAAAFAAMAADANPGKVLHAQVIKAGRPGEKVQE